MSNKKEQHIYEPFQNMKFDNKHCFLCGVELNDINSSLEHVFPKWLQKNMTYGINHLLCKITLQCNIDS